MPDGLFWTVPIPEDSVHIDLNAGTATLQVSNLSSSPPPFLPVRDWGNDLNDFLHGPSVPATVSYTVRWSGLTIEALVRDTENHFVEQLLLSLHNGATLEWSGSTAAGLTFVSDPASTSTSPIAAIGRERNGVFFNDPS